MLTNHYPRILHDLVRWCIFFGFLGKTLQAWNASLARPHEHIDEAWLIVSARGFPQPCRADPTTAARVATLPTTAGVAVPSAGGRRGAWGVPGQGQGACPSSQTWAGRAVQIQKRIPIKTLSKFLIFQKCFQLFIHLNGLFKEIFRKKSQFWLVDFCVFVWI